MYFIFDIIALMIFFLTVSSCRTKGFFKSFFGTMKVVISILIAYIFMPSMAYFYRTSFVEKLVTDNVAERINILTQKTAEGFNLEKLFSDMPTEFTDIISRYDASLDLLSDKFGSVSSAASDTVNELAGNITSKVTHTISDILGFATLFIGSLIVLSVVVWLIGLILKLPVLSGIDKALGFLFGIITGVLLVWVYSNLLNYGIEVLCAVKPGILSENVIENTFIIKYISDNFPFGFAA